MPEQSGRPTLNRSTNPDQPSLTVVPAPEASDSQAVADKAALDEAERLAADAILDEDDGDEPGQSEEESLPIVAKVPPKFSSFRTLRLFDLWGTTDRTGMEDAVFTTTKTFAQHFEEDVELRRIRWFEAVTADRVSRLIYCFLPENSARTPNLWIASKLAALEAAQHEWTTMRSRTKLGQYTFRKSSKDHGEPKFSGLTTAQHIFNLKKLGLLVDSTDHPFFKKATDTE
jgi:hypothetical protein